MGHFSRFIRPGMKRITVDRSDSLNDLQASADLMCSAYRDDNGRVVMVLINYSAEVRTVDCFNAKKRGKATLYTTTGAPGIDMKSSLVSDLHNISLPPRSIHTLVIN